MLKVLELSTGSRLANATAKYASFSIYVTVISHNPLYLQNSKIEIINQCLLFSMLKTIHLGS